MGWKDEDFGRWSRKFGKKSRIIGLGGQSKIISSVTPIYGEVAGLPDLVYPLISQNPIPKPCSIRQNPPTTIYIHRLCEIHLPPTPLSTLKTAYQLYPSQPAPPISPHPQSSIHKSAFSHLPLKNLIPSTCTPFNPLINSTHTPPRHLTCGGD